MIRINANRLRRVPCWMAAGAFFAGWLAGDIVCHAQQSILVGDRHAQLTEQFLRERLRQSISLDYDKTPLAEVVAVLGDSLSIDIRYDSKNLSDSGIDPATLPITFHGHNITAASALSTILWSQGLTWMTSNEQIAITTRDAADTELSTRIYLVRDFVATNTTDFGGDNANPLINLITGTVATQTWDELGGPGTIDYFANAGALVVSQTQEVHDSIDGLLAGMRQARGLQGLKPVVEPAGSPSTADTTAYAPPKRTYAVRHAWNVPQVHR